MEIPITPAGLIDQLRSWFFAKDRSIYLAANCLAYLSNGAYLSMAFIAETVLTGSAASVTFSNIPQGFRQLILTGQVRSDAALEIDAVLMRFNADSGANYDYVIINGSGAAATVVTARGGTFIAVANCEAAQSRGNNFTPVVAWIMDYSRTSAEARLLSLFSVIGNLSADTDLYVGLRAGNWRNTNVVTSLTLAPNTGPNFVAGSRFQLYGVL